MRTTQWATSHIFRDVVCLIDTAEQFSQSEPAWQFTHEVRYNAGPKGSRVTGSCRSYQPYERHLIAWEPHACLTCNCSSRLTERFNPVIKKNTSHLFNVFSIRLYPKQHKLLRKSRLRQSVKGLCSAPHRWNHSANYCTMGHDNRNVLTGLAVATGRKGSYPDLPALWRNWDGHQFSWLRGLPRKALPIGPLKTYSWPCLLKVFHHNPVSLCCRV